MRFISLAALAIALVSLCGPATALGCSESEYDKLMDEIHNVRTMEDLVTISINNSSETIQAIQFNKDLQRLDEHLSDVIKRLNEGCADN